jgi:hypothetical protein
MTLGKWILSVALLGTSALAPIAANADLPRVRFVADRGYTGPQRVGMGATNTQAPMGHVPRGPVASSGSQFRSYVEAKARGIYDPGYRHWLNGNGVVVRR